MYKLSLAKRDIYLTNIYEEIRKRKKILFNKYQAVRKNEKNNEFLHMVKKDYESYYNYILEEKERQVQAMSLINKYIDNIIVDGKLTDEDIQKSRRDQNRILEEIDHIKRGIDKLIKKEEDSSIIVTEKNGSNESHTDTEVDTEDDIDISIENTVESIKLHPEVDNS